MTAEDDCLTAFGQSHNQILDFTTADRVQTRRGLVQDHQIRIIDQRLSQSNTALHALRKLTYLSVASIVQPHHFDQLVGTLAAFHWVQIEQIAKEIERLLGVQVTIEIRFLGEVPNARLGCHMPR